MSGTVIEQIANEVLEATSTESGTQFRTFVTRSVTNGLFERRAALIVSALRLSERMREHAKLDIPSEAIQSLNASVVRLEQYIERVMEESTDAKTVTKDAKQICKEFDELQGAFKEANHAVFYQGMVCFNLPYTTDVNSIF